MSENEHIIEDAKEFIRLEAEAVAKVADQIGPEFVQIVHDILNTKGKVIITGAGTSGTIGRRFAHLLSVTGTPSFYLDPTDGLHGSLGVVTEEDVVLAISKGGESSELIETLKRSAERGADTIALTSVPGSTMAGEAGTVVVVDSSAADLGGVVAMGSTLAHAAWGDALCKVLMQITNYGWDQVLQSHPGGAVGKKSLKDVIQ
ncbi:MAG: SIS domain-containing protein [Ancrocorticia sp.]|uniref:SIS domain-containing protein n=1 Tax=Ancrocorticia sp. TaxID=2593684 RepID=UPI003F8EFAD6